MIAMHENLAHLENNTFIFIFCNKTCLLELSQSQAKVTANSIYQIIGTGIYMYDKSWLEISSQKIERTFDTFIVVEDQSEV